MNLFNKGDKVRILDPAFEGELGEITAVYPAPEGIVYAVWASWHGVEGSFAFQEQELSKA